LIEGTPTRRFAATSPIKGEVGAPFCNGRINGIKNRIQFLPDLMRPEAQFLVAVSVQPSRASGVVALLNLKAMLVSVYFNDQLKTVR
jgi:hypothetical protein